VTTEKTLEKRRADVVRLAAAEEELSLQHADKLDECARADGDAILADELAGDAGTLAAEGERVARGYGEVVALSSAIDAARRARHTAIVAAWHAEAELKREQAAQLRDEANVRQERTDALLGELREHEGIDYVPGFNPAIVGPAGGLSHPPTYGLDASCPRTMQLRYQADALDKEADELMRRKVRNSGAVTGGDATELLAAVLRDPFRMGPTLVQIAKWIAGAEPPARERWAEVRRSRHQPADDAAWTPTFALAWKAGVVLDTSEVRPPDLRERDASGVVISHQPSGAAWTHPG